jgi:hypothetical protein
MERCPICNEPLSAKTIEVGAWQASGPIRRDFAGWECRVNGCDEGPRAQEWANEMGTREQEKRST